MGATCLQHGAEFDPAPQPDNLRIMVAETNGARSFIESAVVHDELTGLPTRVSLIRMIERALGDGAAQPARLLCVGLDRFRLLNDARGREFGDRVLIHVARRLLEVCPLGGRVSRIGGDVFALLYPTPAPSQVSEEMPARLLRSLAEFYVIDGERVSLTSCLGAVTVARGESASALLQDAEIALDHARDAGPNQVSLYTPSMTVARRERFQLEQSLHAAVGSDAFRLAYQPIVDVERATVIGFEALLRWTEPVSGDVSPGVFIPIAEASGLIVPIGRAVLEGACFEAARWTIGRSVAVNLSPAQFSSDIVETVRDVLDRSGLAPSRLELEVTEGLLLETTSGVVETMEALCRLGVILTLDDFGTGYAGLSYLGRFPFKKIKIDGSFIRGLGSDGQADAIVEAILLLARRLDLSVIAESVETESQLERLRAMGCPYVQGHLLGRPMPPEHARIL